MFVRLVCLTGGKESFSYVWFTWRPGGFCDYVIMLFSNVYRTEWSGNLDRCNGLDRNPYWHDIPINIYFNDHYSVPKGIFRNIILYSAPIRVIRTIFVRVDVTVRFRRNQFSKKKFLFLRKQTHPNGIKFFETHSRSVCIHRAFYDVPRPKWFFMYFCVCLYYYYTIQLCTNDWHIVQAWKFVTLCHSLMKRASSCKLHACWSLK